MGSLLVFKNSGIDEAGLKDEIIFRSLITIHSLYSKYLPEDLINSILKEWLLDPIFIRNHLIEITMLPFS